MLTINNIIPVSIASTLCASVLKSGGVTGPTAQCCVLTNSSPLGVGQAPVENSWGTYKTKNVAQKKLA